MINLDQAQVIFAVMRKGEPMSLINREDLIAEYDRVHVGAPGGARKLMVDAPDVKPEPKWIPCKKRLPDKDGLYLVTYFSGHARWTGTDEFLVDGTEESHWKYANIIAWQPLPKPFREGGDYA